MKYKESLVVLPTFIIFLIFGIRIDIKEDLTLQIEMNLFGFSLLLGLGAWIINLNYKGSQKLNDIQQQQEKANDQEKEVQPNNNTEEEQKNNIINNEEQEEEIMKPSPRRSCRKSSLKYLETDEDFNLDEETKVRSVSVPLEEQKSKRKVSFNEKNNTVHKYRKNSGLEKRNYENGTKEIKQERKLSHETFIEEPKILHPVNLGKKKKGRKTQRGLGTMKENSKNKSFHLEHLEENSCQVLLENEQNYQEQETKQQTI